MKTPIRFSLTLGSPFRRTTLPISVLVTLPLWTLATGARAQPASTSATRTAPAVQPADSPSPPPAQIDSAPADGDLKFVVALFRHGVRSPLKDLNKSTPRHSGSRWPSLPDWAGDTSGNWGDLTPHGATAVTLLGAWYGSNYSKAWGKSFQAYLWADVDERTEKTAAALAAGFGASGISVTVGSLSPQKLDPLFHPFKAMCGTPSPTPLNGIAADIKAECLKVLVSYKDQLTKLEYVLNCKNTNCNTTEPCQPLHCLEKSACLPTPAPVSSPRPPSPITWDGEFSYASTVTEAFLLEYANAMDPGWGRVDVAQLSDLLRLHEFYFQQTERNPYLAGIGSANLVREILTQLNRKADRKSPLNGACPRGDGSDQFVGLVGHDTNLANLNTLLKVKWKFDSTELPADTRNLPENDALPAGALVFELRGDPLNYRVRIQYVTQSLGEIRNAPKPGDPFRIETTCGGGPSPCEMSLDDFNKLAGGVITTYGSFLSRCQNGKQTCP